MAGAWVCANHSCYRVTAQVPRAALALSEAAHGLTVACLPFAGCRARLLPAVAGPGSPQNQPVSRWPQVLNSARTPWHQPTEDALAPKHCPREGPWAASCCEAGAPRGGFRPLAPSQGWCSHSGSVVPGQR